MNALVKCRTAEMGGHFKMCEKCGFEHRHYHSCRNRHCPKCRSLPRAKWTAEREAELLDTTYFHVVFKLPTEIADIALQNKTPVLGILFKVVTKTLEKVAKNPQHLGAQLGFIAALHTWGQRLEWHPHLHCLIPGGGLSPDGRWISCGSDFLPVDVLATTFRRLFLRALRKAFNAGLLQLSGDLQPLRQPAAFARYLAEAGARDWEVYAKCPLAGPRQVLDYIGRNAHSVAISNDRLVEMENGQVAFKFKDYSDGGKVKTMTLPAVEFIRRFILLHVMPDKFHTIRYGGFLGNGVRADNLNLCRRLLGMPPAEESAPAPTPQVGYGASEEDLIGPAVGECPRCRQGQMIIMAIIPKAAATYSWGTNSS